MGGSNLSRVASYSRKQGSFEGAYDEFELVEESPELLVSDEGVQGVEGDGSLLFARKRSGLRGLGLFLSGKGTYSATAGSFTSIRSITRFFWYTQ